jgi:hypothetical protein
MNRGFKLKKTCPGCQKRLWARNGKIVCDTDDCKNEPRISRVKVKPMPVAEVAAEPVVEAVA